MTQLPEAIASPNEATYESLISLIENSQEQLALIIVACDDLRLRQQTIERYEQEAKQEQIRAERIVLGTEPSLRAGLARLGLPPAARVVVTVTGAEWLLRVKTRSADEQSDLDKFFGYLQWTREGLREFRHPIVLWVTFPILREMSRKAPDFWSWRKAVLRFTSEASEPIIPVVREHVSEQSFDRQNDDFLPPPAEVRSEIHQLETNNPASANLATLYQKLAGVYATRIDRGEATNLEQEQQQAIAAFERAIELYRKLNDLFALANTLNSLGNFLHRRSRYEGAIVFHQQSLEIQRDIGDRIGESISLGNLGNDYSSLGKYQRAIDFYQQSLEIQLETGDRTRESMSLGNLGSIYQSLGQYQRASDFYQQSLEISREIGNLKGEASSLNGLGNVYRLSEKYQRAIVFYQQSLKISHKINNLIDQSISFNGLGISHQLLKQYKIAIDFFQQSLDISRDVGDLQGESSSLGNLGNTYQSLRQYQRASDFYQQSLKIQRDTGDRHGEANSLFNKAFTFTKSEPYCFEALEKLKQARAIFTELKLDEKVKECDKAICDFDRIVMVEEQTSAPKINN